MLFPHAKYLTVVRYRNIQPSRMGTEGQNFAVHAGDEDFRDLFYNHEDDFRFIFENFASLDKVNELLTWMGYENLTQGELTAVLKDTKFQYSKIRMK